MNVLILLIVLILLLGGGSLGHAWHNDWNWNVGNGGGISLGFVLLVVLIVYLCR